MNAPAQAGGSGLYTSASDGVCACGRPRHRDRERCCSTCETGKHMTGCEIRNFNQRLYE